MPESKHNAQKEQEPNDSKSEPQASDIKNEAGELKPDMTIKAPKLGYSFNSFDYSKSYGLPSDTESLANFLKRIKK